MIKNSIVLKLGGAKIPNLWKSQEYSTEFRWWNINYPTVKRLFSSSAQWTWPIVNISAFAYSRCGMDLTFEFILINCNLGTQCSVLYPLHNTWESNVAKYSSRLALDAYVLWNTFCCELQWNSYRMKFDRTFIQSIVK